MSWLRNVLQGSSTRRAPETPLTRFDRAASDAHLAMGSALVFGLQHRNEQLGFIEHCARVTALSGQVAADIGITDEDREDLRAAAQLHEIGMIAVPRELLEAATALTPEQRERVREQAAIGAEIVHTTQSPRTAWLIEHQYADYATLSDRAAPGSVDLLLASILRAADVFDTLQHPRPYQRQRAPRECTRILMAGSGSHFHPDVVHVLLERQQAN